MGHRQSNCLVENYDDDSYDGPLVKMGDSPIKKYPLMDICKTISSGCASIVAQSTPKPFPCPIIHLPTLEVGRWTFTSTCELQLPHK